MWLNMIILSFACLLVGFILGWIVACPRRWDAYVNREPVPREDIPALPAAGHLS